MATYDELPNIYEQDINSSAGGDYTSISGGPVGNTGIAGTLPNFKPAPYKGKVPKGGKKFKKPSKPIFKMGSSSGPDDPEYRDGIN